MTTTDPSDGSSTVRDECFRSLADARRRAVVRIVHERSPSGISKPALASRLAAVTTDTDPPAVTEDEQRRALRACHHRLLPPLFDAGLLEETDDGTVRTTDHWAFDDGSLESAIAARVPASSDELDAVFEALADPRRRRALSILDGQSQPMTVESLAGGVAKREVETDDQTQFQDAIDRRRASLVHAHLPLLNDAHLVAYDAETGRVAYEGHPVLRDEWLGAATANDRPERPDRATSLPRG